jgi:DNA repair exonuclease SbcCD ATPase subunit
MQLLKLKLRNFRIHKHRDFDFNSGVTAIIGPANGVGKSSIVEAIQFAFTGKVDAKNKEQVITLGEATGYVEATFELNGVQGTIERHLDSSKVILNYGEQGKKKKAADVLEMWKDLLQINPEIFENVIIAKQGQIPLLFTGDVATRTSAFQKIFLVPDTEKLRNIIWVDYIKKLPPPYPVEDLVHLQEEHRLKTIDFLNLSTELEVYNDVTIDKYEAATIQINEIKQAIINNQKIAEYQIERKTVENEYQVLKTEIEKIEEEIKNQPFSISDICNQILENDRIKTKIEQRTSLQDKLANIVAELATIDIEITLTRLAAVEEVYKGLQGEAYQLSNEITELKTRYSKYSKFEGKCNCPTCNHTIEDIVFLMNGIKTELETKTDRYNKVLAEQIVFANKIEPLKVTKDKFTKLHNDRSLIENQLIGLEDLVYSEEEQSMLREVEAKLNSLTSNLTDHKSKEVNKKQKLTSIDQMIDNLKHQFGDTVNLPAWLQALENAQVSFKLKLEEKQLINNKVYAVKGEINNLTQRFENTSVNKAKNDKRDSFEKILLALYDAFHINQFSRKVIQRYTAVVTDYLLDNLNKFNLPYMVTINDSFGIDVTDSKGYLLPKVSGGQEQMIGLCLRLALLQLFAQNFGMIIIDEGSTGFHKNSKEVYFEMIRNFPKEQIKQILIVDHDERLAEYVDNVIDLGVS